MHNKAQKIVVHKVVNLDVFRSLVCTNNVKKAPEHLDYIYDYVKDLGAKTIIEEQNYFDRDFLAEFSTFYSLGASGYPNICRRLHFFSENITREQFETACGIKGERKRKEDAPKTERDLLRDSYLGFSVIRPIPQAPFGRTVLAWYKETLKDRPRQTEPCRKYVVHLAGIELAVTGLAWQQQDAGISACASVGVWTLLHSAAYNDTHSIPTTADVTRAAHQNIAVGAREFPSEGLRFDQMCESVKVLGLSPFIIEGDKKDDKGVTEGFLQEKFCSSISALIRSGYPCLMMGRVYRPKKKVGRRTVVRVGLHVSVIVGYRPPEPAPRVSGETHFVDKNIEHVYIHDDNIGPSVRFAVKMEDGRVMLTPSHPKTGKPEGLKFYGKFSPLRILVAVDSDLRTSSEKLNGVGMNCALRLSEALVSATKTQKPVPPAPALALETRFMRLAKFMSSELEDMLGDTPKLLSRVRLELAETVRPMSLHLGVVRIDDGNGRLADVLYDTTDSDLNHPVFATVCYRPFVFQLLQELAKPHRFGDLIKGYGPVVSPSSKAGSKSKRAPRAKRSRA